MRLAGNHGEWVVPEATVQLTVVFSYFLPAGGRIAHFVLRNAVEFTRAILLVHLGQRAELHCPTWGHTEPWLVRHAGDRVRISPRSLGCGARGGCLCTLAAHLDNHAWCGTEGMPCSSGRGGVFILMGGHQLLFRPGIEEWALQHTFTACRSDSCRGRSETEGDLWRLLGGAVPGSLGQRPPSVPFAGSVYSFALLSSFRASLTGTPFSWALQALQNQSGEAQRCPNARHTSASGLEWPLGTACAACETLLPFVAERQATSEAWAAAPESAVVDLGAMPRNLSEASELIGMHLRRSSNAAVGEGFAFSENFLSGDRIIYFAQLLARNKSWGTGMGLPTLPPLPLPTLRPIPPTNQGCEGEYCGEQGGGGVGYGLCKPKLRMASSRRRSYPDARLAEPNYPPSSPAAACF